MKTNTFRILICAFLLTIPGVVSSGGNSGGPAHTSISLPTDDWAYVAGTRGIVFTYKGSNYANIYLSIEEPLAQDVTLKYASGRLYKSAEIQAINGDYKYQGWIFEIKQKEFPEYIFVSNDKNKIQSSTVYPILYWEKVMIDGKENKAWVYNYDAQRTKLSIGARKASINKQN